MPAFAYTARDSHGTPINGSINADTIEQVTRQLRADGKYPISVRPMNERAPAANTGGGQAGIRVGRNDVVQITTQLSIMLETGVTLIEAIECIAAQVGKPKVKKLLDDLIDQLHSGVDFSTACSRHPKTFPRLFVALMRASEKSGMMAKLLGRANTYMREEQETLRRVKGALTYPGIMLGFAVTTTIFLLAFVLPRFTAIYAGKGAALPLPTKILMNASQFLVSHWIALLIGTIVSVVAGVLYFKSEGGARVWHYLQLKIPLLGAMFRKMHLSRGLRTIGTMAGAGVNLLDCVKTANDLCSNSYFRDLWADVTDRIEKGKAFSEPLFESPLVPRAIAQMIASGERSGKLSGVMEQIAGFAEEELKEKIAEMTRYIEPAMIIVMGVIIGGVALALLLPIFSISKVIAH